MIKRYCDRCGQQIDEGVHAWYVLELHGTDGEFRHKEFCEECYEYLCEKDEVPMADCKTEPQTVRSNLEPFRVEPQTDNGIGCSRCEGRFDCYDRDMPHAVRCNNYGKVTDGKE